VIGDASLSLLATPLWVSPGKVFFAKNNIKVQPTFMSTTCVERPDEKVSDWRCRVRV